VTKTNNSSTEPKRIKCDVAVIGSGIGGLSYALAVSEAKPSIAVAIITKKEQRESSTNYAQGGIASVMSPLDSFESHLSDTLKTGGGLCDAEVVEKVVRRGPQAIKRLTAIGVRFTHADSADSSGASLDLALEGGHSANRVVHADDLTGREIERALLTACRNAPNIHLYENHIAADVLTAHDGEEVCACGVVTFDASSEQYVVFDARIVMLATGGVGQVYQYTTNPMIATGDGIAMAYRAGAAVANLEFVQFHPTAFYEEAERSLLISEAVRGHGGKLKTISGHAFMKDYDMRGDLAPRDIVARAIDSELNKSGDSYVILDITSISPEEIVKRFPNIHRGCLARGVDITREPIPVVPSAHYLCGGVRASLEGVTSIKGLMVCGESAHTGMHGANRLASNSLLEAVVMAEFSAEWTSLNIKDFSTLEAVSAPEYTGAVERDTENIILAHERRSLKLLMSDYLGIVRSLDRLSLARDRLLDINLVIGREFAHLPDVYAALELRNLALVALLMTEMALERHESRGLHYLTDYPETNDLRWKRDSVFEPLSDDVSGRLAEIEEIIGYQR
jgi:L-aspartate oxidase